MTDNQKRDLQGLLENVENEVLKGGIKNGNAVPSLIIKEKAVIDYIEELIKK